MAQHVLTFAQLKAEAEHAMAGAPDSRQTTDNLVNGALEYLLTLHAWNWRTTITTLDLTDDENQIDLPANFGQLVGLVAADGTTKIVPTSITRVGTARVNSPGSGVLYIALGVRPQLTGESAVDPTKPMLHCLEIAPTPEATTEDALVLTYRRLVPVLSGETDVPAIPIGYFELFRVLVRAYAYSDLTNQAGHDWERFRAMLPDYIAADGTAAAAADGNLNGELPDVLSTDVFSAFHTEILMPGD